jgi:tRNA(Ile)-lysidine synthetase-like protein
MLERIRSNLKTRCNLADDLPILVAVSGGPDSLCLLDVLYRLDLPLIVAHFDHRLRKESESEAEEVRKIAEGMGIRYVSGKEDVRNFAEKNVLSLEEAARISRYRFLFQQAEFHQVQAVAVGHTADDQVETILMHLLRGAGMPGLKGMLFRSLPNSWSRSIPLVRPLLNIWREEILDYLAEHDLSPNLDSSNLDVRFYRNRLRGEVIPYLESIQPTFRRTLWRTAEILGEDLIALESLVDIAWEKCVTEEGYGYLVFSPDDLNRQLLGVQRRLFRRGFDRLRPGLRDVDFNVIERAVRWLDRPSCSGRVDLAAGVYLQYEKLGELGEISRKRKSKEPEIASQNTLAMTHEEIALQNTIAATHEEIASHSTLAMTVGKTKERLWMVTWEADLTIAGWPQIPADGEFRLDIPGELVLESKWRVVTEMTTQYGTVSTEVFTNPDPFQAWLDLDGLQLPIIVRSRHPGDRLSPLGMGGKSMKVADLMVNVKLPLRARERWPLLISGGEIAWIPGLRIGQSFRIKKTTKRVLYVRIIDGKENPPR